MFAIGIAPRLEQAVLQHWTTSIPMVLAACIVQQPPCLVQTQVIPPSAMNQTNVKGAQSVDVAD